MSEDLVLDPARCVLIVQELQHDVVGEGGAFEGTGSAAHAKAQDVVARAAELAALCRARAIPVIHVWYIVELGAPGLKVNAPLFAGVKAGGLVRGTWGAAPMPGVEPQPGDLVVEKMRMSAWEGTRLEVLLTGLERDTIVITGAFTDISVEHTVRTGADKGYVMVVPEDGCSSVSEAAHRGAIDGALRSVSTVTTCAAVRRALGA